MIANGCGRHDEGCQEGGDEARRKVCDDKFLAAMLLDVKRLDWYMKPVALTTAYSFYSIIRVFGKSQLKYTS